MATFGAGLRDGGVYDRPRRIQILTRRKSAVVFRVVAPAANFDPSTVPWQIDTPTTPGLALVGF